MGELRFESWTTQNLRWWQFPIFNTIQKQARHGSEREKKRKMCQPIKWQLSKLVAHMVFKNETIAQKRASSPLSVVNSESVVAHSQHKSPKKPWPNQYINSWPIKLIPEKQNKFPLPGLEPGSFG